MSLVQLCELPLFLFNLLKSLPILAEKFVWQEMSWTLKRLLGVLWAVIDTLSPWVSLMTDCFPAEEPDHQWQLWTMDTVAALQQRWSRGRCELLFVSLQILWQPHTAMWRHKLWRPYHWSVKLLEVQHKANIHIIEMSLHVFKNNLDFYSNFNRNSLLLLYPTVNCFSTTPS